MDPAPNCPSPWNSHVAGDLTQIQKLENPVGRRRRRFGEIAASLGYISEDALMRAVRQQEAMGEQNQKLIGQILLDSGDLGEWELQRILHRQELDWQEEDE